jgi:hypothetical protein
VGNVHELVAHDVCNQHVNGVAPDVNRSQPHQFEK